MDNRTNRYAEQLSKLIQAETISYDHQPDITKFYHFQTLLREMFPAIFATCTFEDFHGSFLMKWSGKSDSAPILLMNHQDVVEAPGAWKYPPFSGTIADRKLWGRGTLDTKGGLWAMLQAVNELVPNEEAVEEVVEETVAEISDTEALFEAAEAEFEEELEAKSHEAEVVPEVTAVEEAVTADAVDEAASALDEISTIMKNVVVNGDIEADGSLDLFGAVNGNIKILGKLNVTGKITGNSEAVEVYAQSANVVGDITSHGSVKIGNDSVIRGNIYATSAVVAGAVKGDIDVKGPVILDASAIVMGNIKSKSVQINNGAVIEGLCSQCYAEVSPSSFFRE